jgi:hypothetical protein
MTAMRMGAFLKALERRPFRPFDIELNSGYRFPVRRLKNVWMPDGDIVVHTGGGYVFTDPSEIAALHFSKRRRGR